MRISDPGSGFSRRAFLATAACAATAPALMPFLRGVAMAKTATQASPVRFEVPAGACDCHVHVLEPARFPYVPNRRYTPGEATVEELLALHRALGVSRVVLVQNSVYGSDNACLVDALGRLGARARGVAVIDETTSAAAILALDQAGVRGVRLNLAVTKQSDVSVAARQLRTAASRIPTHWHIHINATFSVIVGIKEDIAGLQVPVLLDHFAQAQAEGGPSQSGFGDLLALLRAGKAYVKLSGPYQISKKLPTYDDIAPIAQALVSAAPDHVLWGSDWPHTGGSNRPADADPLAIEPFRDEDDGRNFSLLAEWVPDAAVRRRILVDTPARIYGFSA